MFNAFLILIVVLVVVYQTGTFMEMKAINHHRVLSLQEALGVFTRARGHFHSFLIRIPHCFTHDICFLLLSQSVCLLPKPSNKSKDEVCFVLLKMFDDIICISMGFLCIFSKFLSISGLQRTTFTATADLVGCPLSPKTPRLYLD